MLGCAAVSHLFHVLVPLPAVYRRARSLFAMLHCAVGGLEDVGWKALA